MWNITFKLNQTDVVGAEIGGDQATVYWNGAPPRKKKLQQAYDYRDVINMHPMEVQFAIMNIARGSAITDMQIGYGKLNWADYYKTGKKE